MREQLLDPALLSPSILAASRSPLTSPLSIQTTQYCPPVKQVHASYQNNDFKAQLFISPSNKHC